MRPWMQNKAIPMPPFNSLGRGQYNKVTLGYLGKMSLGLRDGYI